MTRYIIDDFAVRLVDDLEGISTEREIVKGVFWDIKECDSEKRLQDKGLWWKNCWDM